jgi:hypothetical protein
MASMLRWSLEVTPERPVTLLYQAKDAEHWPLGRTLHAWQSTAENMSMHTFFSRLSPEDLEAEAQQIPGELHLGKLDGQIAAQLTTSPDADYYMCGPDGWMEQIREQLQAAGVEASHIHWESFGSAVTPSAPCTLETGTHEVTFSLSDVKATWQDPEQTLWELAQANEVILPSGCLSGACGSCRVRLLAGQVQYDRSISIELANDECLTCIARPVSAVTIEA